jgi:GT2 family glycosyltransferase
MKVSVIIAHDERRGDSSLKECVDSVKAQGCTEIMVATQGNKSEARNRAVNESSGEILIFFDDDVTLRKHCIEELLEPFSDEKVGIVGGVNVPRHTNDWRECVASSLLSSSLTMFRSAARYTPKGDIRETDESEVILCNLAIRKDVFMRAGGLPADVIPCEENVLINNVQKLGYKIVYSPFAVVYHERPKVFMLYWRKIWNYGRGRGILLRKRKGGMKMLWRPNLRWLAYVIAAAGHYVSYLSGLIYGLLTGESEK